MKKIYLLLSLVLLFFFGVFASPPKKYNLMIAPGSLSENSVTLLWDKQFNTTTVVYEILVNEKLNGSTGKTNFTITGLSPSTAYKVSIRLKGSNGNAEIIKFKTAAEGKIYNILDYRI
jgi:exo-poly-alpha-galacturonosidase